MILTPSLSFISAIMFTLILGIFVSFLRKHEIKDIVDIWQLNIEQVLYLQYLSFSLMFFFVVTIALFLSGL